MAKATKDSTLHMTTQLRALAKHWRQRADEYRRDGRRAEAETARRIAKTYERELSRTSR